MTETKKRTIKQVTDQIFLFCSEKHFSNDIQKHSQKFLHNTDHIIASHIFVYLSIVLLERLLRVPLERCYQRLRVYEFSVFEQLQLAKQKLQL